MRNGAQMIAWADGAARGMIEDINEDLAEGVVTVGEVALMVSLVMRSVHLTSQTMQISKGALPPRYAQIAMLSNDEFIYQTKSYLLHDHDKVQEDDAQAHPTADKAGERPVDAPHSGGEGPSAVGPMPTSIGGQSFRFSPWNFPRSDEGQPLGEPDATLARGAQDQDPV